MGRPAAIVVSAAILFIVVIALAGLGFVVVKALGGEEVTLPGGALIKLPPDAALKREEGPAAHAVYRFPPGCTIRWRTQRR